jgi:hypothetical protein
MIINPLQLLNHAFIGRHAKPPQGGIILPETEKNVWKVPDGIARRVFAGY